MDDVLSCQRLRTRAAGGRDTAIKARIIVLFLLTAVSVSVGVLPGASAEGGAAALDSILFLPIARSSPPVLFADDFESGIGQWTPFLNYWRLNEEQWYHDKDRGFGTGHAYAHKWSNGVDNPKRGAHDALTMLLVPGSQNWSNYRVRVKFRAQSGRQAGVWFRGTYRDVETSGQWLTGYYFTVDVRNEGTGRAKLWQLRTTAEHGDEPKDYYWYHFSNPLFLVDKQLTTSVNHEEWHEMRVEVQGPRIKCWVDDELAIDYVDNVGDVFLKGTIGLYVYGSDPRFAYVRFDDLLVEPLP